MAIATAFKPEYVEHRELGSAILGAYLSSALDVVGCTDKQMDFKAHRILAKAVSGDYKILCWWAAEQEESISDGKPMYTVNKENATLLGICAFPRTGKSSDADAITRLNVRIRTTVEHYIQSRGDAPTTSNQQS